MRLAGAAGSWERREWQVGERDLGERVVSASQTCFTDRGARTFAAITDARWPACRFASRASTSITMSREVLKIRVTLSNGQPLLPMAKGFSFEAGRPPRGAGGGGTIRYALEEAVAQRIQGNSEGATYLP